jgi:hypothetical protein
MAYTVTQEQTNFGNLRGVLCDVTADAASGNWQTGFATVSAYTISPISMNSGAPIIKASTGTITVSNATNGDHFYLVAYGR